MNIYIIIIVVVIFIVIVFTKNSIENFKPYNVFKVADTLVEQTKSQIPTILDEHESIIKTIDDKNTLIDFKNVIFTELPYFQSLIQENELKGFIISFLESLNIKDRLNKKIQFSIPLKFTNVKYAKGCNSTYYFLQCDILNNTFNVSKTFNICIKKNNNVFNLIYIKSDNNETMLSVKGIDILNNDSLFRTKNSLFLFDPFKTSSSDM